MSNIHELMQIRAHRLAHLEYLSGLSPLDGDPEEQAAYAEAYRRAKASYLAAEQAVNSATCTLTAGELAELARPVEPKARVA